MTTPVMPDVAESGYLITRAIAYFLATHETLNFDGILFPSAQAPQDASPGQNVILFHKASAIERLEYSHEAEYVSLWESDEDSWVYYPQVWEASPKGGENHPLHNTHIPAREPSLRLARNSIVVHKIQGVRFTSDVDTVHYAPWSKDSKYQDFR